MASRVSVVVVSYNTRDLLRRCLASIEPHHETIVVDNASTDGSAEMVASEFQAARLVRNSRNLGFGAANNLGMDAAGYDLVLFLNSDAYAEPGAIDLLASALEDPSVAAAGGRLSNPDRSLQWSSANELTLWAVFCEQMWLERLFPRSRLFCPYWNSHRLNGTSKVAQVMGACLMARRLERFDERFFLYCEDTELCKRLIRHGSILYVPEARFVHELGSSGLRWQSVALYNRGKELYFAIHHGRAAMAACWFLNRLGALARLIAWSLVTISTLATSVDARSRMGVFARVLFAPLRGPSRS